MKTIGFAGMYYTLWSVETEKVYISVGAWYYKTAYTYYQNLSKDLDQAKEKAKNLGIKEFSIDENLRGKKKSFSYNSYTVIEPKLITDAERLYRIIMVNDRENLVAGVREEALKQAWKLGYLEAVRGEFKHYAEAYGSENIINKGAYKWKDAKMDTEKVWLSSTLKKTFIGIF
jgi:hypothetical protein